MNSRLALFSSLLCTLMGCGCALGSDLALIHTRVYPAPGAAALNDATVVMPDQRITSVSASG